MTEEIENKVAKSPLVTIDLEALYPAGERAAIDIAEQLFQGLILREMDFRAYIKSHDWAHYQDQHVAIYCSADAIVPTWAYMLIATKLAPFAKSVVHGPPEMLEHSLFMRAIDQLNLDDYADKPIVVKGCSKKSVPISAYVELSRRLQPLAKSIMYGEPCSTVPVYKQPRK